VAINVLDCAPKDKAKALASAPFGADVAMDKARRLC
jgi:hypothetical protein